MSIPVSKVVQTTVQVSPSFPQSQVGLGILCIFGVSARLPIGQRIRSYSGMASVANDFSTIDPEYALAQSFFAQSPSPATLKIARRYNVAVPGELLGSVGCDKVLADYTAINNASLKISVDGTVETLTNMDLSGAASLNAVATIVQTALAALKAGATVVYDGTRFIVRSGTTGVASTVAYAVASGVGTDIAHMLGLLATDQGVVTAGSAAETVATTLSNVQALDPVWYGFTFTPEVVDADIQNAAAWAETQTKMFGYTSADSNIQDGTQNADLASTLKTSKYSRTIGQWDPNPNGDIVSILACLFTTDFTQPNSSKTLKFKLEPGVTPIAITESQREVLESKNINYYTYFGTSAMFAPGVMADGGWADEKYALDALNRDIRLAVFGYIYEQPTKIPQTDKGMARIVQVIEAVMQQYVRNGTLAPGVWNGQPIGQKNTGDFLDKGFYVYATPVAQQLEADRTARVAPPVTIIATGAGAIHSIAINLIFQQ